ncbi:hypothetical protein BC826DRAFT_96541 [Russula brevipes]|nr:hypothetical protein BC826DRAFT_96541 [Russula brevipes]
MGVKYAINLSLRLSSLVVAQCSLEYCGEGISTRRHLNGEGVAGGGKRLNRGGAMWVKILIARSDNKNRATVGTAIAAVSSGRAPPVSPSPVLSAARIVPAVQTFRTFRAKGILEMTSQ